MMKISLKSLWMIIRNNWVTKCVSLFAAMVIWLVIVRYVNPHDTRVLNDIKIQVIMEESVPASEGLVLVTDYNETLSITYTANRDVIATLSTDKITAHVDLSSVTKSGEYNLPVKIDTNGQNITIENQSVKTAVLNFEKSASAQIKINVNAEGSVPEGYVKNDPVCVPSVINVEGPESIVSRIASAQVKINESEFAKTSVYNSQYEFLDIDGNVIDRNLISCDYDTVDVTITVLKTKVIPVTATIVNSSGGNDADFVSLKINPSEIIIAGGEETLDTYNSYDLGTIDVAGFTGDYKSDYVLSLQNGIKNIDGISTISVDVSFGDIRSKTIEFKNFQLDNLAEGQKAKVHETSLSVTFRGISDDIAKLNSSNVNLVVDFNNLSQSIGTNRVPVYAVIPDGYKVGVSGKYYLTVDITK